MKLKEATEKKRAADSNGEKSLECVRRTPSPFSLLRFPTDVAKGPKGEQEGKREEAADEERRGEEKAIKRW